ncbi:SDR family oxidoreductase [Mucilaginibacter terrae]|uniref:SDR family oxidoreductase n=1 Tax=Mucilaginibacter terrae TaxID=1955052 RepID=UPI00363FE67C
MNILIIGSSGLVGGNLYNVCNNTNIFNKVIGTHLNYPTSGSIYFDPSKGIPQEIENKRWDVIVHTGALTHVDKCEEEVDLSYKLTVNSTEKLLDFAKNNNSKFVYLSTDYVFDGLSGPYTEASETNPLNTYGKHKLISEEMVSAYSNSLIIRITNVYGEEIRNKNFIARILESLKGEGIIEVQAPIDQFATPVNANDVARAIVALVKDDKTGTYHISSTDFMSRVQLLQQINKVFNNRIIIRSVETSNLNQAAVRPLNGGLLAIKFMNEYPDFIFSNVSDYLRQHNK